MFVQPVEYMMTARIILMLFVFLTVNFNEMLFVFVTVGFNEMLLLILFSFLLGRTWFFRRSYCVLLALFKLILQRDQVRWLRVRARNRFRQRHLLILVQVQGQAFLIKVTYYALSNQGGGSLRWPESVILCSCFTRLFSDCTSIKVALFLLSECFEASLWPT